MRKSKIPLNFKVAFKLRPLDWILYNGLIAFFRITGLWKYPIAASGDLETMTWMDKVYWLYKTIFPMRRARRGSGLEAHFELQKSQVWTLPQGFRPKSNLSLSAVGDLMPHPYLLNSVDTLYSGIEDTLFGVDISMANLESVLFDKASGEFSFSPRSGPPLFYDFKTFDVVKGVGGHKYCFLATACNHSLDFGLPGVMSTIQKLKSEGIQWNGVNENETDAFCATLIDKQGFKLGLISHTFGLNAYQPPANRPRLVNRTHLNNGIKNINLSQIQKQIEHCYQNQVDFVIAQLHWGLEHEFYPIPEQVELAHHLAEMGIDAIFGHHPHVVQPVEYYRTQRDPDRIVPIFYSLGNLINPCSAEYLCLSSIAKVNLVQGVNRNQVTCTYVKNAEVIEVEQVADDSVEKLRLVKRNSVQTFHEQEISKKAA